MEYVTVFVVFLIAASPFIAWGVLLRSVERKDKGTTVIILSVGAVLLFSAVRPIIDFAFSQ